VSLCQYHTALVMEFLCKSQGWEGEPSHGTLSSQDYSGPLFFCVV
jgi:hypothetical protein